MNIEEANRRIEECLRTGAEELDLSQLGVNLRSLNEISALQKCVHLKRLSITLAARTVMGMIIEDSDDDSDMSLLENLKNLTILQLETSYTIDISFLANLPNLQELWLYCNIVNTNTLINLPNLEGLYLRFSNTNDIGFLKDLINLKKLDLGSNQISNISPLRNLTNLTMLWLDCNPITDIRPLESLINLEVLFLSENKINNFYTLEYLTNLSVLYIEKNEISDIRFLKKLNNLTELHLGINEIQDISPLEGLVNLTVLNLCSNKISDISFLKKLTNLEELQLGDNEIQDLSYLEDLANMTFLDLHRNEICNIRPLEKLTNLTILNLENNKFSYINPLKKLRNLVSLNLAVNNIRDIIVLERLINLTELQLYDNQIDNIEPLEKLTNLTKLKLGSNRAGIDCNKISNINPLKGLINLTELWLSNVQVDNISPLKSLINLTKLFLINTQISDISPLGNLSNLIQLEISKNQISDFRPLLSLKFYQEGKIIVAVDGNPNEILNNVVKSGYEALKKYYDELDLQGAIPNDYLKVIILGNSTSGKTSLLKYWGNKTFDERQVTTHGIYTPMAIPVQSGQEDILFNIKVWDFGGQDYYHATHRLFITQDGTFIVVCAKELENKPEEEKTIEYIIDKNGEVKEEPVLVQHYPYRYWIDTIAHLTNAYSHASHKPKMPMFLVENKCGLYEKKNKRRMRLQEDISDIPFEIIGNEFYHLDIKEASLDNPIFTKEYNDFEEQLIETLQQQIEDNRYKVLTYFPVVRDTLERLAKAKQDNQGANEINDFLTSINIKPIEEFEKLPVWITYEEYQDIVKQSRKIKENEKAIPWDSLHTYLQNLCGSIFHFNDIPELKDIVFIDPNWLHKTIYDVLNLEVLENEGRFTLEQADEVIDGNIIEAATFLKAMMVFELIFEIPHQTEPTFIAPQYLPKECPMEDYELEELYEEVDLSMELTFPKYLPSSLMSRIISLKGKYIKNFKKRLWKYGVVYNENLLKTFIHCQPAEKKIKIYLGKRTEKEERKNVLRSFMRFMEEKFSNDLNEMYITLPEIDGTIKWKELYANKESNLTGAEDYSAKDRRISTRPFEFLVRNFKRKPVNFFICYSHEVQEEMEQFKIGFERQLNTFCGQHNIDKELFIDLELRSGDNWHEKIQENIRVNDVLVCLLSPGFFTSDYIQQHEYGKIFQEIASKKRNTLIVPVNFKSSYISVLNNIKEIQFFSPTSKQFGLDEIYNFSFCNLLKENKGLIDNYMTMLFEQVKQRVIEIWENSEAV